MQAQHQPPPLVPFLPAVIRQIAAPEPSVSEDDCFEQFQNILHIYRLLVAGDPAVTAIDWFHALNKFLSECERFLPTLLDRLGPSDEIAAVLLYIFKERHKKKWSRLNLQERNAKRRSDPVWLRLNKMNQGDVSAPQAVQALRSILDEEGQATVRPTQQLHVAPLNPHAHVITDQQQQQQQQQQEA